MGVAVSSWELAGAVAREGHLGVVSGTALDTVCARRLQLGDSGGHVRRALAHFPVPEMVQRILDRYYVPGGIGPAEPFKGVPMFTMTPTREIQELVMVANFVEVFLARERGQGGMVGINYLYKIQLPILASAYGAMLAGVDVVIVGAGSPSKVPAVLDELGRGEDAGLALKVQYATSRDNHEIRFSPRELMGSALRPVPRPHFLAIVASVELAAALCAEAVPPDGFVVEGHVAGGHNAPPRGPRRFDDEGQPVYGPLDEVDPSGMVALGRPFWFAGGYGVPGGLARALEGGAAGIQVGTAFALCRESGIADGLKASILDDVRKNQARVRTDPRASPTSFPFKVLRLPGSLSEVAEYEQRQRVCDGGFLRVPFKTEAGGIGYRCPSENEKTFARKGGRAQNTDGRVCLCNGLLATVGLGARRRSGYQEPPVVTLGDHANSVAAFLRAGATSYGAADVIARLEEGAAAVAAG